jgi:predicted esterase
LPIRYLERPPAGAAAGALVFFHGYWGIPDEFVPYLDKLDPQRRLHGFLPQAPVHVNSGRYSWDRDSPEPPESQLREVAAWLDALPYERKVLAGWSQGGWVAYMLGLGAGRARPAGLIVLGARYAGEPLDPTASPEVLIAHGRGDESVEVEHARRLRDELGSGGVDVTYLETGGGHQTDDRWLPPIRDYLSRVIQPSAEAGMTRWRRSEA